MSGAPLCILVYNRKSQSRERMVFSVSRSKKWRRLTSKPTVTSSPLQELVRGSTRTMNGPSLPLVEMKVVRVSFNRSAAVPDVSFNR